MPNTDKTIQSFSRGRRWVLCLNSVLTVLALIALLAMANYLANGYYKRFQLSSHTAIRLQPQTLQVLNMLTEDVHITLFFDPKDENGYEKQLYTLSSALLREYRNASKHISVTNLNYVQYQGQARELLAKHNLTNLKEPDFVLIECRGYSKVVYARSLAEYDLSSALRGEKTLRYSEFRGERLFTSAIYAVTHPQALKACFLRGHGESQPDSPSAEESYSRLATLLDEEINADWESISLLGTNTIPSDCQLLIIAGPRLTTFSAPEISKIKEYLAQGNRLMLLLDNRYVSGVEKILADYGVEVPAYNVREQDIRFMLTPDGSEFFVEPLPHPTTTPILDEKLSLHYFAPRTFELKSNSQLPGAPEVKVLARTSERAINGQEQGGFNVGITVEQGVIKGVNSPRGGTRILALGDVTMFSNQGINMGANAVFAGRVLNWLMDRPEIMVSGIAAKPIKEYKLMLTQSEMRSLQLIFLCAMPGGVLFVGWLVWLRRRK